MEDYIDLIMTNIFLVFEDSLPPYFPSPHTLTYYTVLCLLSPPPTHVDYRILLLFQLPLHSQGHGLDPHTIYGSQPEMTIKLLVLASVILLGEAFVALKSPTFALRLACNNGDPEDGASVFKRGLGKAAWYGAEALGNARALLEGQQSPGTTANPAVTPPSTFKFEEAVALIKADYDSDYFLTGKLIDKDLYSPSCYFCDPFSGFSGRERFISNLSNLSLFVSSFSNKLLDFDSGELYVVARVLVRMQLNLPWKPVIAWGKMQGRKASSLEIQFSDS